MIQTVASPFRRKQSTAPPSPHLVLLHGLASTPKEFGLLALPLRRAGVTLHAPTIRGYTHETLADRTRWENWVEEGSAVVRSIAKEHGPVILGGLCTGAVMALGIGARQDSGHIAGLALLSPLFTYDGWGLPWWYGLRRIAYMLDIEDRFWMKERPPFGLKNQRMRQWVRQQMENENASVSGPPRVPLRAVRESERLSAQAPAWLADLRVPSLVVHAREDEICRLAGVQAAVARAPAHLVRMVVLENSYHMITADNDRLQVGDALAAHAWACHGSEPDTHLAFG